MAVALLAAGTAPWGSCYHAQQAVGSWAGRRRHGPATPSGPSLNRMVDPAPFGDDEDMLAALTLWAVEQRYPATQPDPTFEDARAAIEAAREAVDMITARLRVP